MSVPWLIVSPHCDDAVFACGELLAAHPGSVVATVFAGTPRTYEPFTEWDRACGFEPGDDVMAIRRGEDARALAMLNARPLWLPFLDSQYRDTPRVSAVAEALARAIHEEEPRAIAFPLGLFHSDHVLTREAMLALAARETLPPLLVYHDALYRRIPGAAQQQMAQMAQRGLELRERAQRVSAEAHALKRAAIGCYRSQLRALATPGRPGHLDAYAPELYLDLIATVTAV
ncbi:MAG TPA: PIG-L family deacetylase [Burkholderiales bacterium]|nr:PIG-L family deacetylase [Burkholderiales bacterium]